MADDDISPDELAFSQRVHETILREMEWPYTEIESEYRDELVERGVSDHEMKRIHTGIYARCCQFNGEFAAGIAVLEPLISEIAQALRGKTLKKRERRFYEKDLTLFHKLRDELKAGIKK